MRFLRFEREYLTKPYVTVAFWVSLAGGAALITVASLWLRGTRWEVACTVLGAFSLLDACLLRYAYEIKQAVKRNTDLKQEALQE